MQTTAAPKSLRGIHRLLQDAAWFVDRARFARHDVNYDVPQGQVTIGLWLVDRSLAEYEPGLWPIRRATLHWRRHDLIISKALNFEFQINEEVPFATLSGASFSGHKAIFTFGKAMTITIGVSEFVVAVKRTGLVRTDWGIKGWTIALAPRPPINTRLTNI